jgi:uncharacterized repeat protein (TIGR01451 family)
MFVVLVTALASANLALAQEGTTDTVVKVKPAQQRGEITALSANGFTLQTEEGTVTVTVSDETRFRTHDWRDAALSFSDLSVGDNVSVSGTPNADGSLTADKVAVAEEQTGNSPAPAPAFPSFIWGDVAEVTGSGFTVDTPAGPQTFSVADSTRYQLLGQTEGTLSDLQPGDRVKITADGDVAYIISKLPENWAGVPLPDPQIAAEPEPVAPATLTHDPKATLLPCAVRIEGSATNYASPQAAVTAATAGDTIQISGNCQHIFATGGLSQSVYVDKNLTFRGGFDASFTEPPDPVMYPAIIDATDLNDPYDHGRVMVVTNTANVWIEGLILTNGNSDELGPDAPNMNFWEQGGGILATSGNVTLDNSTVMDSYADENGGGIYSWDGLVKLQNKSRVINNEAYYDGGGIYNENGATVVEGQSEVSSNTTDDDDGGGIYSENGNVTVTDSQLNSNIAYDSGGAILVYKGTIIVNNSTFRGNYAGGYGGALYVEDFSEITVNNSLFQSNYAYYYGGAIYFYDQNQVSIADSTFSYNYAYDSYAGAIYGDDNNALNVSNTLFEYNHGYDEGGAIYLYDENQLTIANSQFLANTSEDYGGALYFDDYNQVGISDSIFNYNHAYSEGGAIYGYDYNNTTIANTQINYNNSIDGDGGGIYYYEYGSLEITNSSVDYNFAYSDGGGIYYYGYGQMFLDNVTVNYNFAYDYGGGIYNDSNGAITILNSEINYNVSQWESGGGFYSYSTTTISNTTVYSNISYYYGGGIYVADGAIFIYDSDISYNRTTEYDYDGGGIYTSYPLYMENSRVSYNLATGDGGGIYIDNPSTIRNSIISHNSAPNGYGGGLYVNDDLVMNRTLVSDNHSTWEGGGMYVDYYDVTINDSTISHNSSADDGGGIYGYADPLRINNSSIVSNTGGGGGYYGGGIYNDYNLELRNTVIAYNSPEDCYENDTTTSYGYNYASQPCDLLNHVTDIDDEDPYLGPLQDNGGWSWTHHPLLDSPLIDGGNPGWCTQEDQRGVTRPKDGNGDGDETCDIGAVEVVAVDLAIEKTASITETGAEPITYTITVANEGPDTATEIVVSDYLPWAVEYTGSEATDGSYDYGTGMWDVGTLEAGQVATLWISGTISDGAAGSVITNTASVYNVEELDINSLNDSSSVTITVTASDIAVSKTASITAGVAAGDTITYTIVAWNADQSLDATGVEVNEVIPWGVTVVTSTNTQGWYDEETGIWYVGDLYSADTISNTIPTTDTVAMTGVATLTVVVTVDANTTGDIINTVTATSDQADLNPDDNTASVTVQSGNLSVYPRKLEVTLGSNNQYTTTLMIINESSQYLNWTLSDPNWSSWLFFTPTEDAVAGAGEVGSTRDVEVVFDSTGLEQGVYSTTLQVSDNVFGHETDVEVILTVRNYYVYVPMILKNSEATTTTNTIE